MLRIAHISDLHFSKVTFSPLQFFSKRFVGNFNQFFNRRKKHDFTLLNDLPALFQELKVDLVIITGDFTTTGRKIEFEKAKKYVEHLHKKVIVIPGNHDHYTRLDYKRKIFYEYFPSPALKNEKVELGEINHDWWYLALDTVVPTHWFSSQGLFSEELEKRLKKVLQNLPHGKKIICINHFPFFPFDEPSHRLRRGMALHDLLKTAPAIQFYLHGHTHRHCFADLRKASLPIILDSGSITYKKSPSFNLLELGKSEGKVEVYYHRNGWQKMKEFSFLFSAS